MVDEQWQNQFEQEMAQDLKRLAALYQQSEQKQETNPDELQEKLTLYGNILEIIGDLESYGLGMEKMCYAYRKEADASKYLTKTKGEDGHTLTGKERDKLAEIATRKYRRLEAHYGGRAAKWGNRKNAVQEQINIMKRRQDSFMFLGNKANYINGYGG